MRRRVAASAALACATTIVAAPAHASIGVAVDYGFHQLAEPLPPGKSVRLPTWGVRNPGTQVTGYSMAFSPLATPRFQRASPSWFRFDPQTVTLRPGTRRAVNVRLRIPRSAKPGRYEGLMKAQIVLPGRGGVQVGAAAAARIRFRVRELPLLRPRVEPPVIRAGRAARVRVRMGGADRCRARVRIVVAGQQVRTSRRGTVTITLRRRAPGTLVARATKRGCRPATVRIRVLPAQDD